MVSSSIREYGNVVWTNHALERIRARKLTQDQVLSVLRHPDKTFPGKKEGSVKFIRTIDGRKIHAIGFLNERKQWVVVSTWVRGEEDQWGFPEKYIFGAVGWMGRMFRKGVKSLLGV